MESRKEEAKAKHPELLMAARRGDWKRLQELLGYHQDAAATAPRRPAPVPEVGVDIPQAADTTASSADVVDVEFTFGPDLDTILHVVASSGDSEAFLKSAEGIHGMANHLVDAGNGNGDTPLHCAARAGRVGMVSRLIHLAGGGNDARVKEMVRKQNKRGETALHEALRLADEKTVKELVEVLMKADAQLARLPSADGTSPLYLAVSLGQVDMAELMYSEDTELSYSGPDGQNVLHAAVLNSEVLTRKLLEWNKDLTTRRDKNGSTPLHFAASVEWPKDRQAFIRWPKYRVQRPVMEANPAALYQPDLDGSFPVHVAASVGLRRVITIFLKESPGCAGLRDAKGRTFLHVAAEKKMHKIVYACAVNSSLKWILNMQDNNGDTALHLAIRAGNLQMFAHLLGNRQVHLNLTNGVGQTPLDVSRYARPAGLYYYQNSERKIYHTLEDVGARSSCCRLDHFEDLHTRQVKKDGRVESGKMKDSTQTLCIGAVLLATVTFGTTFAIPGGYRADDHKPGGTPTLAWTERFVFTAFIVANTLAFLCSSIATVGLMFAGTPMVRLDSRTNYYLAALYFLRTSITSLTAAFALGVYMVLAPVVRETAVAICIMSPMVFLAEEMELLLKGALLALPLCIRVGPVPGILYTTIHVLFQILVIFWPVIVTFGWATHASNVPRMELPAQPPTPMSS